MKKLIYDCEIIKAIPDPKKVNIGGIEYCEGWEDHKNMGISCIGVAINLEAWSNNLVTIEGKTRYITHTDYLDANLETRRMDSLVQFQEGLNMCEALVGFNNQHFDDNLIKANGFTIPDNVINYDILAEIWEGAGLGRTFVYPTHAGFSLDAICKANGLGEKTGSGANAAIMWQQGKEEEVIDYCMNDIKLTEALFNLIQEKGEIIDPRINNFYFKKYNPKYEFKTIKVRKLEDLK